jgi:hypothetical protein
MGILSKDCRYYVVVVAATVPVQPIPFHSALEQAKREKANDLRHSR